MVVNDVTSLWRRLDFVLAGAILVMAVGAIALWASDSLARKYPRALLGAALFVCLSPFLIRAQMLWRGSFWISAAEREARMAALAGFVATTWLTVLVLAVIGAVASSTRPVVAAVIPPSMAVLFYWKILPAGYRPSLSGGDIELLAVLVFSFAASLLAYASARAARANSTRM